MSECQACGSEVRSDRTLCPNCRNRLRNVLDDLADAWAESLTTLTRQDARGGTGGGSGTPLPYNATMSERRDEARDTITAWAEDLMHGHIPTYTAGVPGRLAEMRGRLDAAAVHPRAGDMLDELTDALHRLRQPTDRAPDRIIVGRCDACGQPLVETQPVDAAVCPLCAEVVDVKAQRDRRLAAALEESATVPELARALSVICRRTITEKRVARWVLRGALRLDFSGRAVVGKAVAVAESEGLVRSEGA